MEKYQVYRAQLRDEDREKRLFLKYIQEQLRFDHKRLKLQALICDILEIVHMCLYYIHCF